MEGVKCMARPKKNGEHISLYFDKELLEGIRTLADEQGWSLVTAFERSVKLMLEQHRSRTKDGDDRP